MPEMSLPTIVSRELSRTAWIRVASYQYSVEQGARPIEEVYEQPHIVLLHGGVVQCRTSRSPVTLFPGAVLLANARVPHEYSYQPGWPERCVSFAYDPRVFEDILRNLGVASARFHSLSLAPSARFAAIAQLLVGGDSRESAEEWAYALAAEVLENQAGRRAPPANSTHIERRRAIEACRLIESRSSEPLPLATIAAELGLSPFHFLRCFKNATGVTPHQYIVQTRLRSAARLVLETSQPIIDIALAAGFPDLANFNRSFRKAIGCAPRLLRQRRGAALRRMGPRSAEDSKIRRVSQLA